MRVHPELLQAQRLPKEFIGKKLWEHRFEDILAIETRLSRAGTKILKFFLHISKEESAQRLLARTENPKKNWKLSPADFKERKLWRQYQQAYQQALQATTSEYAPWFIIPADDKKAARLSVASIVVRELEALDLRYPKLNKPDKNQLEQALAGL